MTKVKGVSVGGDGTVWCADRDGRLHQWDGSIWRENPTAVAEEVAVGDRDNVWCRNRNGELFRAASAAHDTGWQQWPGGSPGTGLRSISANRDGELWIVNGAGEVWRLAGGVWDKVGSTGDALFVATGSRDRVAYVARGGALKLSGADVGGLIWATVRRPMIADGQVTLRSVSYSVEGAIWASDTADQLFKRGRTDRIWRHNPNGAAVQVSVGPTTEVWCVNAAGQVWRASHALGNANTYWHPIPEPGFARYTVRQGDTVFSIVTRHCPGISSANHNAMIDEIVRLNNLRRGTDSQGHDYIRIETGQTLSLPPCP